MTQLNSRQDTCQYFQGEIRKRKNCKSQSEEEDPKSADSRQNTEIKQR